jgi:hypothetical protein
MLDRVLSAIGIIEALIASESRRLKDDNFVTY